MYAGGMTCSTIRRVLLAPVLASALVLTPVSRGEPLDNESLLSLATAEVLIERAEGLTGKASQTDALNEAFLVMSPVLDRELPAQAEVWVALGRWALAARDDEAGAVAMAGLRRELPEFMSNQATAEVAAGLHAREGVRTLVPIAAARLEAGDTPLEAVSRTAAEGVWEQAHTVSKAITDPAQSAAAWTALATALENAGHDERAGVARQAAAERLGEITARSQRVTALTLTARARAELGDKAGAANDLDQARSVALGVPSVVERDGLLALVGRALAATGDIDGAAELIDEFGDLGWEASVRSAIVERAAGDDNLATAEHWEASFDHEWWSDKASLAIIEALIRAGRMDEAAERVAQIKNPLAHAEGSMMLFPAPASSSDLSESHIALRGMDRALKNVPTSTDKAAGIARIVARSRDAGYSRIAPFSVYDAIEAANDIPPESERLRALNEIARVFADAGYPEIGLKTINLIPDIEARSLGARAIVEALASKAWKLSDDADATP